ncbi:DinB family protein [Amycolatopsis rhizosphaerae]|uniref:DinB family protein n=1 Tax=Amycolatopsis rhizosphaerae TaxID=2053003 RepID=A0A558D3P0_9PSEU|nr:DinB family protein [Amycolatopsis rhizosphaerae]TVT55593.1 DinB family protein [Amycolatopsis rhizosphaerae]
MTDAPKRVEPAFSGGQREQLTAFLDYQRGTVTWKCGGLSDEQARRSLVPSELTTVAGLLQHLTLVEEYWFGVVLDGQPNSWKEALEEDPDAEFRLALRTPMSELLDGYERQCERSREITAKLALEDEVPFRGGTINLRWVLIHLIEETARHAGHLDLLREMTDGLTGE